MLRLLTFGGLGLESDDGSAALRLRPPRLALLAVLAAAGERGVSRERLAGLLWSEADDQHASHSLRQARYALRNELNREVIQSDGATLSLDSSVISSDVAEFQVALAQHDGRRAVALSRGPFLDGFYLPGAPAFERWVEEERARLSGAVIAALQVLAKEATDNGDQDAALAWWRELTVREPLSGRHAVGYLKALGAIGRRAEALAFARQHEALVRRELETDPDPEIKRLEGELRAIPTPTLARSVSPTMTGPSAALPDAATLVARSAETPPPIIRSTAPRRRSQNTVIGVLAAALLVMTGTAALAWQAGWFNRDARPVLAVGLVREEGVPDSLRAGGVLTDMLATNLARVEGLAVLSNSRVLELMQPGPDSAARYTDAARRAGASEVLEGRLTPVGGGSFELEMRRVELKTGIVRDGYRARAADRYSLVDSITRQVARRFNLASPGSSVATATTSSPIAYRLYEQGLREQRGGDLRSAMRLMHAALEEDSTFAMAAFSEVDIASKLGDDPLSDGRRLADAQAMALRLARHAPDRERLIITSNILTFLEQPEALALAESLATRFANDARAFETVSRARWNLGDWGGAVDAMERAIALDSLAEAGGGIACHLCADFNALEEVFTWWDSLPAAARVARRYLKLKPTAEHPSFALAYIGARLGDSAAAYRSYRQNVAINGGDKSRAKLRLDIILGAYESVETDVRPLLASSAPGERADGANYLLLVLRNEGRLRDAIELHRTGWLPGFPAVPQNPNDYDTGILALESGDARAAATVFHEKARRVQPHWSEGQLARARTWNTTLEGMCLAAAGDTGGVRALIDSVEQWGSRSAYGRDRKAHHYLRGLIYVAQRRDEDATREFRAAMHSPNFGFTRVNYELGRALMRLGRPSEAVGPLQSSLRGEIDASNLYITRTDLHELLAEAFDAAGQRDSAAAHYRAVTSAWRRADPLYHQRRARAAQWLSRYTGTQANR
ncbi:MAG TPA: BTAD domain-containing putative transcriptional regulator [Gemmatimonadaceae bacterium]|nr:BTAD domain-containing putative transcriptional regulator [Gemmatimonadaceae bacterium]